MSRTTTIIIVKLIILSMFCSCSNRLLKCDELDSMSNKAVLVNVYVNPEINELLREKAVKKMKRQGITTDTNVVLFSVFKDSDIYLLQYNHKDMNRLGGCGVFAFDSLLNIIGYCFGQ